MSVRTVPTAADILARYTAGYFPLYDFEERFYWERLPVRAVIPLTPESISEADKLAKRPRKKFLLRYTTAVREVITLLQDSQVKPRTWVRNEVIAIYTALHSAGLLHTIEAYDVKSGKLAGGLLGIVLPGTFIAETMFSLAPDASKLCLCQLLCDAHAAGHRLIDVQTPHDLDDLSPFGLPVSFPEKTPHPCLRLGEITVPLSGFLREFRAAAEATFPGLMNAWLRVASTLAQAARRPADAPAILASLNSIHLRAAWPMLKNNVTPALGSVVAGVLASATN